MRPGNPPPSALLPAAIPGGPPAASAPGVPVFTLRLGATRGLRPDGAEVAGLAGAFTDSFSLTATDGYFRGYPDPGWAITLATADPATVATLAENLREHFRQEGVGIEAYGRYLRCHAARARGEVLAELQGLASGFAAAYFRTTFTFAVPRPAAALPVRFAILSAQATTGESWSGERNQAADQNLHRLLLARGLHPVRITGASPDGRHAEPGWLAETTLQDAVQIGREFLQDAIYWVESDVLHVIRCRDGKPAIVGTFSPRVVPTAGTVPS